MGLEIWWGGMIAAPGSMAVNTAATPSLPCSLLPNFWTHWDTPSPNTCLIGLAEPSAPGLTLQMSMDLAWLDQVLAHSFRAGVYPTVPAHSHPDSHPWSAGLQSPSLPGVQSSSPCAQLNPPAPHPPCMAPAVETQPSNTYLYFKVRALFLLGDFSKWCMFFLSMCYMGEHMAFSNDLSCVLFILL